MPPNSRHISHSKDGDVIHIPLDREVEVPRVRQLVVDHKTWNALHRLEYAPVRQCAYRGLHKGEALAGIGCVPSLKRFFQISKCGTLPILCEWRIAQFEVILYLLKCGRVDPARRADARFSRPAK